MYIFVFISFSIFYSNIIDIGALDSHNLEQHEYMERSRAYAKRIETGNFKIPKRNACLLQDIPAPEKVLSGAPISYMDEQLVSKLKL